MYITVHNRGVGNNDDCAVPYYFSVVASLNFAFELNPDWGYIEAISDLR